MVDVEPTQDDISEILENTRRVAVIGMREQGAAGRVTAYMLDAGFDIVPVNPQTGDVFGIPTAGSLGEVQGSLDMVQLFRRSEDVPTHVEEIIKVHPRYVWMQSGIRNEEAAARMREAGITVIQDRCLMTDHRRRATS